MSDSPDIYSTLHCRGGPIASVSCNKDFLDGPRLPPFIVRYADGTKESVSLEEFERCLSELAESE